MNLIKFWCIIKYDKNTNGKNLHRDSEYEKEQIQRARKQSIEIKIFIDRLVAYQENKRK